MTAYDSSVRAFEFSVRVERRVSTVQSRYEVQSRVDEGSRVRGSIPDTRFEGRGSRVEVRGSRVETRGSSFEIRDSRFEIRDSSFQFFDFPVF